MEKVTATALIPFLRDRRCRGAAAHFLALVLVLSSLTVIPSSAQQAHSTEAQVKAAYLYNFGKFVRWQVDRVAGSDSLDLCVLGKDPFGAVLDSTVEGESIEGRKITVRRLTAIPESSGCDILFVSLSEEGRLNAVIAAAQHAGMLTVSDIPRFAERGGVIGFVLQQDRVRFEVNRAAAERSHLILSSELLKVAGKVIDKAAQIQP